MNSKGISKKRQVARKAALLLAKRTLSSNPMPYARASDRGELKYVDTSANDQGILSTGGVVLCNGTATGTDYTNRIGRKIMMKSIRIYVNMFNAGSTTQSYPIGVSGKISLVYDTQPNGATAPTYTAIYNSAHPGSPLNLNNRDRFKVLWTKNFVIGSYAISSSILSAGSPTNVTRQTYKKVNLPVIYGGTTAAQADIQTGAVYLCAVVDANNGAAFDYNIRIRYIDN